MPSASADMIVIEQGIDRSSESVNFGQSVVYCTYIAMGFIYAYLLSQVVDRVLMNRDPEDAKGCSDGIGYISYGDSNVSQEEHMMRLKRCDKVRTDKDIKKYIIMAILGVLSIAGGAYLVQNDPRYVTGGGSIALGGLFTIIYFTIYNWTNIDKTTKLVILASSFAALFYGSTKMY